MSAQPNASNDILKRIEAYKREEIKAARLIERGDELLAEARRADPPRPFRQALQMEAAAGNIGLIAEIKKASPSKGIIREDFDPAALAVAYEAGGATCLSVLTDGPSFSGSPEALIAARAACSLPVLRKDFMFVPEQIIEARAMGADCILVIMTAVDDETAHALVATANDLGMAALLEVHDETDMHRALALPSALIGVNNRDLRTFKTDLAVTHQLAQMVPNDRLLVSESGIGSSADLETLRPAGVGAVLVGESLMRHTNVEAATRALLAPPPATLTHIDQTGAARMVDVGNKDVTERRAVAEGIVTMSGATLAAIRAGDLKKGDALGVARVAGIMAAKRTHELIPLCHPLPIDAVNVDVEADPAAGGVRVRAEVRTTGRTGVEMEALTAASVACLTVYDMAKALEKGMTVGPVRLVEKVGGKSGDWSAAPHERTAAE